MSLLVFDIANLFANQFGVAPVQLDIAPADNQFDKQSVLGSPYYEQVQDGNGLLGKYVYLPVRIAGVLIPYAVVSISGSKTIVETPLVARRGTVKEQIALEDYRISVKGFFISQTNTLPDKEIQQLKQLYERADSLIFRNALTDIFLTDNDKVVIKTLDLPEVVGKPSYRPFTMELVTDNELTLIATK